MSKAVSTPPKAKRRRAFRLSQRPILSDTVRLSHPSRGKSLMQPAHHARTGAGGSVREFAALSPTNSTGQSRPDRRARIDDGAGGDGREATDDARPRCLHERSPRPSAL